ncbi:MAG: hypothetical protein LBD73_01420 [Deferribacteraceae bacterium]|jgi:hypothetical protein|nr:hypothetical protein [Deferribacteraceae bacterium]
MDNLYFVKDGLIYNLREEGARRTLPITPDISGDYSVLLSDDYFFYTRVGKLNVKKRKVGAIAENYLSAAFPMDLLGGFILFENKGVYTALIYKQEFLEHASALQNFLNRAKKISTAFCELSKNYSEFIFSTGERFYSIKDNALTVVASAENAATIEDCIYSLKSLKCDLNIPLTKRIKAGFKGYYKAAAVFALSFLFFLGGNIFSLSDAKRKEKELSAQLAELYASAGVAGERDPYGALTKLSNNQSEATLSPLGILTVTAEAAGADIAFDTFSINDRSVRIEGKAANFASVDSMVKNLERSLQKQINLEDTRQNGDKVTFSVRYTP